MKKLTRKAELRSPGETNVHDTAAPASKWDSFFYAFIVFDLLVYWVGMNYTIITGIESEHWPSTYGKVEEVNVVEHTENRTNSRGGSTTSARYYEVIAKYSYMVEGKDLANDQVTAGGGWFFGSENKARQVADSARSLSSVKVFYDPSDPSNSVLERGVPERDILGFMFAIPATGGVTGMAFNHFAKKKIPDKKRRRWLSIKIGISLAVVAGFLQWLVLELLI